jgi:hypothetical protein
MISESSQRERTAPGDAASIRTRRGSRASRALEGRVDPARAAVVAADGGQDGASVLVACKRAEITCDTRVYFWRENVP